MDQHGPPRAAVASVCLFRAGQLLRKDRFVTEAGRHAPPLATRATSERCAMVAKLTVSAAGTWAPAHAVEKLMETPAAKSSFPRVGAADG